ncbi:MAG: Fe-S-cluster oxidoreductase [Pseudomonadota bacterium]
MRCVQLMDDNGCAIFGLPERPAFCASLQPARDMCGDSREHAMLWLASLETATAPQGGAGV